MVKFDVLLPLECGVQHYAWGGRLHGDQNPFIADLLDLHAEADQPFAELWMGSHPKLPSTVRSAGEKFPLDALIAKYPEEILGAALTHHGIKDLPFLFKVLQIEHPLSIQAHPDKDLAARLHRQDPQHYSDANHKPEIALALTELFAFCGFRNIANITADIGRLKALRAFLGSAAAVPEGAESAQWLRTAYARLFTATDEEVNDVLGKLATELAELSELTNADSWYLDILEQHPGDRGALSAYFLNVVHLKKNEAIFMGSNTPHCYLRGVIAECMANSDNVVRAGLTPKFIDRDVLLNMLDYKTGAPDILHGEKQAKGDVLYQVPVDEFQLERWSPEAGAHRLYRAEGAVSILLVLSGKAELRAVGGTVKAAAGTVWLWPAAAGSAEFIALEPDTVILRARPNVQALIKDMDVVELPTQETFDFGAYLDASMRKLKKSPQAGDKVRGTITAIDHNSIFLDIGAKSEGIIERNELTDKDGKLTVAQGDEIEAFCVGGGRDEIRLTCKMTGVIADAALLDAFEAQIPVEGRVAAERKGGFEVTVGNQKGFCPFSQIDVMKRDNLSYIGERFTFLITEYGEEGRNIVLSRRRLLEQEREHMVEGLKEKLDVGMIVKGRVQRVMPFGAFVDIGGMEGLIPISELSWKHVEDPSDIVAEGDEVQVVIMTIDWSRNRVSLSLKRAAGDPWSKAEDNYLVGSRHTGTVAKLAAFGAFVELEPGVQGLVHISKLGAGRRINNPGEVVKEGDRVEVAVERVDVAERRISLTMENTSAVEEEEEETGEAVEIKVGAQLTGTVDAIQEYGVFVRLPGDRTGLLHISQLQVAEGQNRRKALFDRYKLGNEVVVVVKEFKGDKISLTLPGAKNEEEAEDIRDYQGKGGALGSLGDIFGDLKL